MEKEVTMAATCKEKGHCLGLTTGCNLYPVKPGVCRERVKAEKIDFIHESIYDENQIKKPA